MNRSGLISGAALVLVFLFFATEIANAKSIKVRGYISEIEAEDVFFVEDIRIVLDKDIFPEFATAGETQTNEYTLADLRVGTFVEVRGNRIFASEAILAKSIKIYAEEYKKIKRTALIEREPHLEKIGNTWMGDFFAELRRRHIYRIGAGYVVAAWAIAQLVDFLSQVWALPAWIAQPPTGCSR